MVHVMSKFVSIHLTLSLISIGFMIKSIQNSGLFGFMLCMNKKH